MLRQLLFKSAFWNEIEQHSNKETKQKKEKYKRKKKHFVPFTVCLWKTSFAKLLRECTEY